MQFGSSGKIGSKMWGRRQTSSFPCDKYRISPHSRRRHLGAYSKAKAYQKATTCVTLTQGFLSLVLDEGRKLTDNASPRTSQIQESHFINSYIQIRSKTPRLSISHASSLESISESSENSSAKPESSSEASSSKSCSSKSCSGS